MAATEAQPVGVASLAKRSWLFAPALTVLALGLGLYRVGSKSIWLDEAVSISYARGPRTVVGHAVRGADPNMSLYYVLLWGWVHVFGEGERAVRGLSVLF